MDNLKLNKVKNKYIDNDTLSIINFIKKYKLSTIDLKLLKEEIKNAVENNKYIINKIDEEIKNLKTKIKKLLSDIFIIKEQTIKEALKKIPYNDYYEYDTFKNKIFNRDKYIIIKENKEKAEVNYETIRRSAIELYEEEVKKINYNFNIELEKLNSKKNNIKWWDNYYFKILQRTVTMRGKSIPLGSKLPIKNIEKIYLAIDVYENELIKKEKIGLLKAKVASADKKSRQLANSVKKQISNQMTILSVCPYCGSGLNIETAHADHIYPLSKGGQSTKRNMVYVCERCNMEKNNFTLNKFIKNTGYIREDIEHRLDLLKKDY